MKINRDYFNIPVAPDFVLCKASREQIGVIQCFEKTADIKYNDINEINFSTYMYIDNKKNPYYDAIDIMKYVLLPDIGFFSISSVKVQSEGTEFEYKQVTARSYECLMGQKYLENFWINSGETGAIDGVYFIRPFDPQHSLMNLVLEKCPEWTINRVPDALEESKQKKFSVDRQDVYSFLTNDVATAFGCVFIFDTLNCVIDIYMEDEIGKDTDVYVSYNNLLKSTDISCSADKIKTCLTVSGQDDMNIREVNLGFDDIIDISYYHSTDYMSKELYSVCNTWFKTQEKYSEPGNAYEVLLDQYQDYYNKINYVAHELMPDGCADRHLGYGTLPIFNKMQLDEYSQHPQTGTVTFTKHTKIAMVDSLPTTGDVDTLYIKRLASNMDWGLYRYSTSAISDGAYTSNWFDVNSWEGYGLSSLEEQLLSYENLQATSMEAGHGTPPTTEDTTNVYYYEYLPICKTIESLKRYIKVININISSFENSQASLNEQIQEIVKEVSFESAVATTFPDKTGDEFTSIYNTLLKELNTFIYEEELNTDNYVVTKSMDDETRFSQLRGLLEFARKELKKVATPQLTFSANMINIFAIPEFEKLYGQFDVGNSIWVTLRDNYNIKARLLSMHIDFYNVTDFSVTFGNISGRLEENFSDMTDMIKAGASAATSLSLNTTVWNQASQDANSIINVLNKGLESANTSLKNGADGKFVIDRRGIFVNTTSGTYGGKDSIFMGNGTVLFTQDNWDTVSMAIGRAMINGVSRFGVFADFCVAAYIAGCEIVGGTIRSENYEEKKEGTFINLNDGTFEFNGGQKQRLILSKDANNKYTLTANGIIQMEEGYIGGSGGFVVQANKMYTNGKSYFNNSSTNSLEGIYLGTDGIALGKNNVFTVNASTGKLTCSDVDVSGIVNADEGTFGGSEGFTIAKKRMYSGKKSEWDTEDSNKENGVYIGSKGIVLGANSPFRVDQYGKLTTKNIEATGGTIGGATISNGGIRTDKWYINSDGSSSFDGAKITNVQNGSNFGGVSISNGNTSGTFSGVSTGGFSASSSFGLSGGAKTQFDTLVANKITADYISAQIATLNILNVKAIGFPTSDCYMNYQGTVVEWKTETIGGKIITYLGAQSGE